MQREGYSSQWHLGGECPVLQCKSGSFGKSDKGTFGKCSSGLIVAPRCSLGWDLFSERDA